MLKTSAAILGLQLSCIVAKLTVQHIFCFIYGIYRLFKKHFVGNDMKMLCCVHRIHFHQESEIKQNCSDIHQNNPCESFAFQHKLQMFWVNDYLIKRALLQWEIRLFISAPYCLTYIYLLVLFRKNLQKPQKHLKHLVGRMFSVCWFTLVRNMWLKIFPQIFVGLREILLVTLLRIKHPRHGSEWWQSLWRT